MSNQEIYEAINRNIVRYQCPGFQKNLTLNGWCSMNFKAPIKNPIINKLSQSDRQYKDYQQTNKQIEEKLANLYQNNKDLNYCGVFYKPFQKSLDKKFHATNQIQSVRNIPTHTLLHLTTTNLEKQAEIKQKLYYSSQQYQQYQPVNTDINYLKRQKASPLQQFIKKQDLIEISQYPDQKICEQSLVEILSPEITLLNLNNHTNISIKMFSLITQYSPNLVTLNLSQTLITDDILLKISESCNNLRNINLSKCSKITGQGLCKFIELNQNLEQLNLEQCSQDVVNDETLIYLNKCLNLKEININHCKKLSDVFLQSLQNLKCIKVFCISFCQNFTSQSIINIINNNLQNLTVIDLSFIECKDFNNILQRLLLSQNIEELNLNNTMTSSAAIANLVQAYNQLQPQKLKILKLSCCFELNSYALNQIIANCNNLLHLELDQAGLNNKQLKEIGQKLFNLQQLSINLTPLITLEGIKKLQFELPDLQIFRSQGKYIEVQDDGLRMPLVPRKKVLNKGKKKKKK